MTGTTVTFSLIAFIIILAVVLYNRLIALRQTRKNAFSDIDVQLQVRYNLVPRLVETVKGYMKHEQDILQTVTDARARVGQSGGDSEERFEAESFLGGALGRLLAVAEAYPDLKADENFRRLMNELADIENKIAAARRFFNSATNEYNTAVQQFPANLLANMFNFETEPFFEINPELQEAVQRAPDVKFS